MTFLLGVIVGVLLGWASVPVIIWYSNKMDYRPINLEQSAKGTQP